MSAPAGSSSASAVPAPAGAGSVSSSRVARPVGLQSGNEDDATDVAQHLAELSLTPPQQTSTPSSAASSSAPPPPPPPVVTTLVPSLRFLPTGPGLSPGQQCEIQMIRRFEQLQERCTVFWNRRYLAAARGEPVASYEFDLILVHPLYGVFVMEIKSESVKDFRGQRAPDQFQAAVEHQLSRQQQDLLTFLKKQLEVRTSDDRHFSFPIDVKYALLLPNATTPFDHFTPFFSADVAAGGCSAVIAQRADCESSDALHRWLKGLFEFYKQRLGRSTSAKYKYKGPDSHDPATDAGREQLYSRVVTAISGAGFMHSTLLDDISSGTPLMECTEQQQQVVRILKDHHRVLLSGPAGSGKTWVAAREVYEHLRQQSRHGSAVLVVVPAVMCRYWQQLLVAMDVERASLSSFSQPIAQLLDTTLFIVPPAELVNVQSRLAAVPCGSVGLRLGLLVVDEAQLVFEEKAIRDLVDELLALYPLARLLMFADELQGHLAQPYYPRFEYPKDENTILMDWCIRSTMQLFVESTSFHGLAQMRRNDWHSTHRLQGPMHAVFSVQHVAEPSEWVSTLMTALKHFQRELQKNASRDNGRKWFNRVAILVPDPHARSTLLPLLRAAAGAEGIPEIPLLSAVEIDAKPDRPGALFETVDAMCGKERDVVIVLNTLRNPRDDAAEERAVWTGADGEKLWAYRRFLYRALTRARFRAAIIWPAEVSSRFKLRRHTMRASGAARYSESFVIAGNGLQGPTRLERFHARLLPGSAEQRATDALAELSVFHAPLHPAAPIDSMAPLHAEQPAVANVDPPSHTSSASESGLSPVSLHASNAVSSQPSSVRPAPLTAEGMSNALRGLPAVAELDEAALHRMQQQHHDFITSNGARGYVNALLPPHLHQHPPLEWHAGIHDMQSSVDGIGVIYVQPD